MHRASRVAPKLLELDQLNLPPREKAKDALHLLGVKSAVQVRIFAELKRPRFLRASFLRVDGVEKIEALEIAIALHVPM